MIEIGDVFKERSSGRVYVITRCAPFGYDLIYVDNGEVCSDARKELILEDELVNHYPTFIQALCNTVQLI